MLRNSIGTGRTLIVLFSLVGSGLAVGCSSPSADLILINGRVYTLDWDQPGLDGRPARNAPYSADGWRPDAEAVAIRGGKILLAGDTDEVLSLRDSRSRVVDLQGATVLPGLVDAHTHVVNLGESLGKISLVDVQTEEEAVEKVAAVAARVPRGEWIRGYGWDEGAWANRYPTMDLLSRRVPDHPVVLDSLHGFAIWGNRLAFEKAGITRDTVAPSGGEIRRDADGNPTGLLLNRATGLLQRAIPSPTHEQVKEHILAGLDAMARAGYVSVHEAGLGSGTMRAFEELEREGKLPLRVYAMLSARDEPLLEKWLAKGPDRDKTSMLRTRSVKAFYDGALGSRGARLLADYTDKPGHRGVSGNEYGFDQDRVAEMMRAGFQVAIHAIGDAGNREAIDFIESVMESSASVKAGRHRIEHAQVLHPSDISRFAQLDMIASMQPPHAVEDMIWAEDRLGASRVSGAYAWRTLRRAGAELVFSSDLPGSDYDVFYGLNAAVARQDKQGKPQGGWYPDQRMTPEEAVRGYTDWAARTAFVENETGVLAKGRWADITVMSIDPFVAGEKDPGRLLDGSILMTIVNGRVVYESPELAPRR